MRKVTLAYANIKKLEPSKEMDHDIDKNMKDMTDAEAATKKKTVTKAKLIQFLKAHKIKFNSYANLTSLRAEVAAYFATKEMESKESIESAHVITSPEEEEREKEDNANEEIGTEDEDEETTDEKDTSDNESDGEMMDEIEM